MNEEIRSVFHAVADLSPSSRRSYYAERQVPYSISAEVESLLLFDGGPGDPLKTSISSAAEQFLRMGHPLARGGCCGPYRLVKLLGHGGMGAVYLAERADGEIEHRVAVKLLRSGADLPSFRERFLRERQILASLNHPGIARLLDAGHTAGQPYLVMEYVDGTRIDEYAGSLDRHGILSLFLEVADAVSYAHRNLIIHRDLKPSNILIDVSGQPKLLDFGIARILDAPEETRTIDRLLTPEYASPEQIRGEAQATSTDIYSLGAVLRKLLTDYHPDGEGTARLPKDLQAILDKAMRAEPDERYVSVEALSDDIRAYLEHRPVRARRGSAWYHTRKFIRRYWVPVAAGGLAVAGLAGGLLLADYERSIAERRFQQVRQLSNQFFELDAEIRNLPGATKARHSIVSASLEYLERLGSEARTPWWRVQDEQDVDLSLEIASAYLRVARVQGVPGHPNLGQFPRAEETLLKADTFAEAVARSGSAAQHRKAVLLSAEVAHDRMILAETSRRAAEARAFARRADERLNTLMSAKPPEMSDAAAAARLYVNIALCHSNLHLLEESARYARRSVEISRSFGLDTRQLGRALAVLSLAQRFSGDFNGALISVREAVAIAERKLDRNDTLSMLALAGALWREGVLLGEINNVSLGRPDEAVPLLQRAMDIAEELARRDPHDYSSRSYLSMAARELADIVRDEQPGRALSLYDHALARFDEIERSPRVGRERIWLLTGSSYALRRLGQPAEAMRRIDTAFSDIGSGSGARFQIGDEEDAALRARGDHEADAGNIAAAIATYEGLLQRTEGADPQLRTDLRHANAMSRTYAELSGLYQRAGHADRAKAVAHKRMELWAHWKQKLPRNDFVLRQVAAAQVN